MPKKCTTKENQNGTTQTISKHSTTALPKMQPQTPTSGRNELQNRKVSTLQLQNAIQQKHEKI
jgi:hypothetical protein